MICWWLKMQAKAQSRLVCTRTIGCTVRYNLGNRLLNKEMPTGVHAVFCGLIVHMSVKFFEMAFVQPLGCCRSSWVLH